MKRLLYTLAMTAALFSQPSWHEALPVWDHMRGVYGEPMGVYTYDTPNIGTMKAGFDMGYNNYKYYWDKNQYWFDLGVSGYDTDYERFYTLAHFEVSPSPWMSFGMRTPYIVRMAKGTDGHFRKGGEFGDVLFLARFEPFTEPGMPFRANLGFGLKLPSGSSPDEVINSAGSGSTDWVFRQASTVHVWQLIFYYSLGYTMTGDIDIGTTRYNYGNIADFSGGAAIEATDFLTLSLRLDGFYQEPMTYRLEYSDDWSTLWNDSFRLSFIPEIHFFIPKTPLSIAFGAAFDMQGKNALGGGGLLLRVNADSRMLF